MSDKPFSDKEMPAIISQYLDHPANSNARRFLDTIAVLQTRSRADRKRIEELEGGTVSGHKLNCSDCGRAMVWSHPAGAWMCPNCVLHRCDNAEDRVRFLDKEMKERTRLWHNANVEVKAQTATIERLRGALEPFAPPYDIIDNDCYGIFLGGLIKRNFVDARQTLDGKED